MRSNLGTRAAPQYRRASGAEKCGNCGHFCADQGRVVLGWCDLHHAVTSAGAVCGAWEAPPVSPPRVVDFDGATPWDRVRIANEIALSSSRESYVRRAATAAIAHCANVRRNGARCIAEWIRANVVYSQETPGVEILQGPIHTLRYRVGDCDDLAILWASMMLACGLDGAVAGVAKRASVDTFYHAVGVEWPSQRHWELSVDGRWGGRHRPPLRFRVPADSVTVVYMTDADRLGFWIDEHHGFRRIPI